MKVSLSRKIHIIAFFQDTCLKARWSEDQSATMPRQPGSRGRAGREAGEVSAMLGMPQVRSWRQMSTKSVAQPVNRTSRPSQTNSRKCQ